MLSILNNYFFFSFLTTLAVSNNLALFFISWVGLNISLYGILLKSFNSFNKEITLKYFISGSIVTMFLLFSFLLYFFDFFSLSFSSASYIFFSTENLDNSDCAFFYVSSQQRVFYAILVCSLLFKLGSFPFHFYLADMYQALNERETMFVYTIALKISIFFTLLKILVSFWYLNQTIVDLLICSGFSSMFVSSFSILKQYKLSKFWAYSYLNSIGFTLLAISSGISCDLGELSFYSAKAYFFTYLITWFGIVDFMSTFTLKTIGTSGTKKLYYISDLLYLDSLGVKKSQNSFFGGYNLSANPSFHLVTMLVSLFGLPPALGFFSKALVYLDLASNPNTIFVLMFVVLLTPLISFGYLKLIVYCILPNGTNGSYRKLSGKSIVVYEKFAEWSILTYYGVSYFLLTAPAVYFFFNKIVTNDNWICKLLLTL